MKEKNSYFLNEYYRVSAQPDLFKIKRLFYDLLNFLLKNEEQIFSSVHAKLHFLLDNSEKPEIIHAGHFLLRAFKNNDKDLSELITALELLLQFFISNKIDEEALQKFIKEFQNHSLNVKEDRAIVLDISEIQRTESNQIYCDIFIDSEEIGYLKLRLWDHSQNLPGYASRKFYLLQKILKKYQTIYVQNIKKIRSAWFSTTAESRIVVEPDYLLNVTSVAECFYFDFENKIVRGNPNLYFLSLLETTAPSEAILKGKLINDYLDMLLEDPSIDGQEFFEHFIQQNVVNTLPFDVEKIWRIGGDVFHNIRPNLEDFALKYRDEELLTEPTFYSEKYGILGRLDVMTIENEKNIRNIIELKSGKPPKKSTWANNKMQVIGYNLLLESTFSGRKGSSSIFYCKDFEEPIRNVYASDSLEQQFIMLRNFIVAKLFKIAENEDSFLSICSEEKLGYYPPFKKDFIKDLERLINKSSREEIAYFEEFSRFIVRELITAKIGGTSSHNSSQNGFSKLWLRTKDDKQNSYDNFTDLSISDFDPSGRITFKKNSNKIVNLRIGDIVLVYNQEIEPLRQQIYKGVLEDNDSESITIKLWNRQISEDWFTKDSFWTVESDFMERGLSQLLQNFVNFLKSPQRFRDLIFGNAEPEFSNHYQIEPEMATEKQKEIISQALSAEDYFLIQGPPGTGKTSAILKNIVIELFNDSEENVFILAYTNRAVEEISDKLRDAMIPFVRLGRVDVNESIYHLSHSMEFQEIREHIHRTRVFVATVATFQSQYQIFQSIVKMDTLIVDEASQLIEPHLLGILPCFKRFILIGDHKQLPAVVVQENTEIHNDFLLNSGFKNFKEPIFERLWYANENFIYQDGIAMLEEHFRMHSDISSLVNDYYDGKLRLSTDRQTDDISEKCGFLESRVVFINSPQEKEERFSHKAEAKLIKFTISELIKHYKIEEIGIVTPWRSQIATIKKELRKIDCSNIYIDTVERFQGSEKDVIIYSFAIHHLDQIKMMQTLDRTNKVDRKLNVAISRAKERLIFIGDVNVLVKNEIYKNLITKIREEYQFIGLEKSLEILKDLMNEEKC